jgi:hypothetical protein
VPGGATVALFVLLVVAVLVRDDDALPKQAFA